MTFTKIVLSNEKAKHWACEQKQTSFDVRVLVVIQFLNKILKNYVGTKINYKILNKHNSIVLL